jgi:aryl-alcohol dehydrogenase-like predicted oxidoreductase
MSLDRRRFVIAVGASLAAASSLAQSPSGASRVITRPIPHGGERIPCVGLGTAWDYDRDGEATRRAATAVLRALLDAGGKLVDTASTYGDAEVILGAAITAQGWRDRLFIATKVEEPDDAEFQRSLARLRTRSVDLLQLHNVRDPAQSLARFREWKAQGLCRYVGITSTYHNDFDAVASVLSREKPDFVQVDYSIDNRLAERRILPLAADTGAAVLTALPFGRARLFRAVSGKSVPDWAKEFAATWAQFFLKYLLGDPRVTAVIPGTTNPAHMADNAAAMHGRLPDAQERQRMLDYVERL